MTSLDSHLEQIAVSAKSLGNLKFPPPKIFTNALLGNHEITTLIRDTEPHERALFSVDPRVGTGSRFSSSRRTTIVGGDASTRRRTVHAGQQYQPSAVAKVLGSDMLKKIQQSSKGHGKRGIDVEVLLQGAERLCAVYSVAGAAERVAVLRSRYAHISKSVAEYESKVAQQQARLNRLHAGAGVDSVSDEENDDATVSLNTMQTAPTIDLRAEEEEIRDLEARKKALEERVAGMEKDLGGLLD